MRRARVVSASVCLLLGPGLLASSAHAQDTAGATETPIEMVVTGARSEEPRARALSVTEVIGRKEIDRSGARDVAELLETRAGLTISRSFRGSELQLRGLDPQYTLILVDGDRVPGQIDGVTDLSRYGTETIDRVEIVRGPGSALYGSDAIGGVINILTRESRRDFEALGMASAGNAGVLDFAAMLAGRPLEPLGLQLTGDYHHADAVRRSGQQKTALSAREQWSSGARAAWELDDRNLLVVRANYLRTHLEGVDDGAGGVLFDRTQLQEQLRASFEHRVKSARFSLSSRGSYSQFRDQYLLDQRGADVLDRYENNREHLGQLTSIAHADWSESQRTTLGAEQLFQDLTSARLSQTGHRYRFAAFAQHAWRVFAAEGGARDLELAPGVRFDADAQFGTRLSPKLALRSKLAPWLEARASYGRGFRAPSFQEQLLRFENASAGYVIIGNPALRAETSDGYDAGLRVWNETLELSVTFFRNDLRNMITYVSRRSDAGGMEFIYDNLTTAWTMGVESAASARLGEWLSAALSYTYTGSWDGENQRKLEGRPPHRATAYLQLVHPRWELDFVARGALSIGRVFYVSDAGPEVVNAPERAVEPKPLVQLDLRASKHFGRALELFAGVDNLFAAGDAYTALRPLTVYAGARARY